MTTSTLLTPDSPQWRDIRLLALDVDGTLTSGDLTFDENGKLYQTFNVRDGFGLVAARRAGIIVAWISGRASAVAQHRFEELGGHHCLLACSDKAKALRDLQNEHGFTPQQCCFVGDDLPDLPAFAQCGVRVAVADAEPALLRYANYVTTRRGGQGAVREVVELILNAQSHWDELLDRFTRQEWTARESDGNEENPLPHGG